jgi:hypothetical protein
VEEWLQLLITQLFWMAKCAAIEVLPGGVFVPAVGVGGSQPFSLRSVSVKPSAPLAQSIA